MVACWCPEAGTGRSRSGTSRLRDEEPEERDIRGFHVAQRKGKKNLESPGSPHPLGQTAAAFVVPGPSLPAPPRRLSLFLRRRIRGIMQTEGIEPTPEMLAFYERRTREHIERVGRCLGVLARVTGHGEELIERAKVHD